MILGFKPQFVEPILAGTKIHTIREDKHRRWKVGNKIHMATGVRTKNYKQFAEGVCSDIHEIEINFPPDGHYYPYILVDGRQLEYDDIYNLSINDGFCSIEEFSNWFKNKELSFTGVIIHWTDLRY